VKKTIKGSKKGKGSGSIAIITLPEKDKCVKIRYLSPFLHKILSSCLRAGFCPQFLGMMSRFDDVLTLKGDPIPGTEDDDDDDDDDDTTVVS
jgi:hypothetical protein